MAKFIKSASKIEDWINDDVTEFCFIGRSNSGKSSIINALANSKIAKSSSTPGRTQLVNFFNFGKYRLVDLPGYGYAKVSAQQQIFLKNIIDEYLFHRKNLFGVFQICDANVLTDDDTIMSKELQQRFINHYVILNKIDKQKNFSIYQNNLANYARYLGVKMENIIFVSAKKKINIKLINSKISKLLSSINK